MHLVCALYVPGVAFSEVIYKLNTCSNEALDLAMLYLGRVHTANAAHALCYLACFVSVVCVYNQHRLIYCEKVI